MPSWTAGKPAAVNLLLVLADNKYRLGRHLSEWAVGSPSLEVGVACAAVEQGSWARRGSCTRCWRSCPSQDRSTRPLAVAALLLVDTAVTIMLEALRDGRYQALAQRVPRMLEEERFHWDFAEGRVHELVRLPPREEPEVTYL